MKRALIITLMILMSLRSYAQVYEVDVYIDMDERLFFHSKINVDSQGVWFCFVRRQHLKGSMPVIKNGEVMTCMVNVNQIAGNSILTLERIKYKKLIQI